MLSFEITPNGRYIKVTAPKPVPDADPQFVAPREAISEWLDHLSHLVAWYAPGTEPRQMSLPHTLSGFLLSRDGEGRLTYSTPCHTGDSQSPALCAGFITFEQALAIRDLVASQGKTPQDQRTGCARKESP